MIEAVSTSETLVNFCYTTRRNIPEDSPLWEPEISHSSIHISHFIKIHVNTFLPISGLFRSHDQIFVCSCHFRHLCSSWYTQPMVSVHGWFKYELDVVLTRPGVTSSVCRYTANRYSLRAPRSAYCPSRPCARPIMRTACVTLSEILHRNHIHRSRQCVTM
jgi:hypothetical protein